ncbi:DUF1707 and FHA domain-containing protein [Actinomadura rayongensis]|uniref:FHA domain-containing protein n=1 Tax=Actinomadura rayongensis TaxID=1429076 RepID=A0A6I4WAC5_9ACTN|nr:DUF1707 and FHA domain-containing protein [Actinomadura rayongensis]MXQ67819.1 FHA domain-containing protein [Actinomadura rayongensis]
MDGVAHEHHGLVPARASDAERDRVLRVLADHHAEGRLSQDTFEQRVDRALRARSDAELAGIVEDLPPTSRVTRRLTGLIAGLSVVTARLEEAWRAPRLPRFALPPDGLARILVGRAPGCHLTLPDRTVSRLHAEIHRTPGAEHWTVHDLGSMNGTRVNGRRLTGPARLRPGDEVAFGECRFIAAAP